MSKPREDGFLTLIDGRGCTAVQRRPVIAANFNATKTACAASASTFSVQVDQQPNASVTVARQASPTGGLENPNPVIIAEDISTATPAASTSSNPIESSSKTTTMSHHRNRKASSFSLSSSTASTISVTSTASTSPPQATTTVPTTSTVNPPSVSTSTAATSQQQPIQPIEGNSSAVASIPAAVSLGSTAPQQQPASTTERFQAPAIEATGREAKSSLSTAAVPVESPAPVANPAPVDIPAPASALPAASTSATNLESQNGTPSRGSVLAPTNTVSFGSSGIPDASPSAGITLETSASFVTAGTSIQTPSSVSSIALANPVTTALGDPARQGQPSNSKPSGEEHGGSGDMGNNPQNITPAADNSSPSSHRGLSTGGIVGVAVGGAVALSLMLLLLWLWRRRASRMRRDTLPSSFSVTRKGGNSRPDNLDGAAAGTNTGPASVEPPVGFYTRSSRSRNDPTDNSQANLNRSPSQFLEAAAVPRTEGSPGAAVKNRVMDWWSRKAEGPDFNPLVTVNGGGRPAPDMAEKTRTYDNRPQLPPALGVGLDRSERFDPFSDDQAITGNAIPSAQPTNPFADPSTRQPARHSRSQSQRASAAYAPAIPPRSHVRSLSANMRTSGYRPPPPASRPQSTNRESLQSVDSFVDRRNKFRSDPFDLELESRIAASSTADVAQMPRHTATSSTYSARARHVSLSSSRYSVSDWSEAGAEKGTGPASAVPAQGRGRESPTLADTSRSDKQTRPAEGRRGARPDTFVGQAL